MQKYIEHISECYSSLLKLFKSTVENAEREKKNVNINSLMVNIALNFVSSDIDENFVEQFLDKSYDLWPDIYEKNLSTFKENVQILFPKIPESFIQEFDNYIKDENIVTPQMKEQLWTKLHSMCINAIRFAHFKRSPDPETKKYTQTFLPRISIKKGIELFRINSLN